MASPLQIILQNSTYLISARGMTIVVRGVYAITLARYLGPEQYGLFNYALGWYLAFMPFTSLGLWAVISRDVGQSKVQGQRTVAQTLALRSIISVLMAVTCGVAGWLLHDDKATQQLLLVFSIAMVGRALANWIEHVLNAYSASKFVFRLEAIFRPLEALTAIIVLALGGGLLQLAVLHGLIWWIQSISGMSLLQRHLFRVRPEWHIKGIRRLLRKGSLLGLSSFLLVWFLQGPLLLSRHTGFSLLELGQLALLLQIFTILSQIPQMLGTAALPILSRPDQQDNDKKRTLVETGLKISWLVGSLAGLIGWFIGPWLIEWIFGTKFQMAGHYLGAILYLLVPFTWGNLLWLQMLSKGLLRKAMLALLTSGTTLTFTFIPFTANWGFDGILIALAVGLWIWALSLYFLQRWPLPLLINSLLINLATVSAILLIDNAAFAFFFGVTVTFAGCWFILFSAPQRWRILLFLSRKSSSFF